MLDCLSKTLPGRRSGPAACWVRRSTLVPGRALPSFMPLRFPKPIKLFVFKVWSAAAAPPAVLGELRSVGCREEPL